MSKSRVTDACVMVIFGAAGDLTKRLLLPALCNLGAAGLLPDNFRVIGVARNNFTSEAFRKLIGESSKPFVQGREQIAYAQKLLSNMEYVMGNFDDAQTYSKLSILLSQIQQTPGASKNTLFYLAVLPQYFATIVNHLGSVELTKETEGWRRVIIEKPFGHDLASAKALDADIGKVLNERQIYRIDHYLGKETVQNLMAFRFSNGIFEPVWNRRYVDHVQITVAEQLGVESRGNYYETAGALRDMVPNHVFQLLSLIAMEPPISFDADSVRDEKAKVLRAIPIMAPEDVLVHAVRGQYGPGQIDDQKVPGYRSEADVSHESLTETFVAMRLMVDSWRWAGVPFYIRTGKRMPNRVTEIAIQFKVAPMIMFRETQVASLSPNLLVVHIQPEEGISLRFGAKVPGPLVQIGDVNMRFQYKDYFGSRPGTGYETLLYDCMAGDGTLFQRSDMVESGWNIVEPILDVWSALVPRQFPNYAAGEWGPKEADELMGRDGRQWRNGGGK